MTHGNLRKRKSYNHFGLDVFSKLILSLKKYKASGIPKRTLRTFVQYQFDSAFNSARSSFMRERDGDTEKERERKREEKRRGKRKREKERENGRE